MRRRTAAVKWAGPRLLLFSGGWRFWRRLDGSGALALRTSDAFRCSA